MTGGFELRGKHVLVIGLARTGIATARFCAEHGATVTASDAHAESELGAEVLTLREEGIKLELGGSTPRYSSIFAFQASGTSATVSLPSISSFSISNRRRMCRL